MAYDYALVHLKFTIPLAALLTLVLRPLLTKHDVYKTSALIVLAFTATLPWDAYLIHRGVWTYPADAIIGPRLLLIPVEELFFFVIQTYITSMLYILMNKPVLHAQYLTNKFDSSCTIRWTRLLGQVVLVGCIGTGFGLVLQGGRGTYLGLIMAWACPFVLITWTCSGYFLLRLPVTCVAVPIVLPTLYLWLVDELALGRGTWSIESGTKLSWCLFGSLEIEEAVFFLVTNSLIVFGLCAFDRGSAVYATFPEFFPDTPGSPAALIMVRGVLTDPSRYELKRIEGIREAVATLKRKSRSFYLASSVFSGRLRLDLVLLYSFCRVADDLIDESRTEAAAKEWIKKLTGFLDLVYSSSTAGAAAEQSVVDEYIEQNFPKRAQSALKLLPTKLLPSEPLYELLEGFRMDVVFCQMGEKGTAQRDSRNYPIGNEEDLELYATRVASTVGELCLWLVFGHSKLDMSKEKKERLAEAARSMGHALQYVNIARDIAVDAGMDRVYLPTSWLKEEDVSAADIIQNPHQPAAEKLRQRLLDLAFKEYGLSRGDMDMLPRDVRGPLVVAVESYMEIGRVLRQGKGVACSSRPGRATVPRSRRIWVAWKALWSQ